MRVLIFHGDLTQPSGGEVNARDWALGLKARGHLVSMYSPRLGPLAEQIRRRGITVADDPSAIMDAPDIIMGTGVHELATLIARFPRSAAIQVAQNFDHWLSSPCPLPQVVLHIAVDDINGEMLANEFGIPRDRIRLVYNAVDLAAASPRTVPLPAKPRRMLVFGKNQIDYFSELKQACASRDIDVDILGNWVGQPIEHPLQMIKDYDIVFGSARTALEGAACGAAVLVGDGRGLAGMLTTSNLNHLRRHNFGREVLLRALTAEEIGKEIDAYDADDARRVSDTVIASAGLDRQLEKIEIVFAEAVDLLANAALTDDKIHQALSKYLAQHLPRVVEGEASPRHRPFSAASATAAKAESRLAPVLALAAKIDFIMPWIPDLAEDLFRTDLSRAANIQIKGQEAAACGDLDRAVLLYGRAMRLTPHNPALFFLRGSALLEAGRYVEAVEDFSAGLKLDPNNEALTFLWRAANAKAAAPRFDRQRLYDVLRRWRGRMRRIARPKR